jgi:hypothetical protein
MRRERNRSPDLPPQRLEQPRDRRQARLLRIQDRDERGVLDRGDAAGLQSADGGQGGDDDVDQPIGTV